MIKKHYYKSSKWVELHRFKLLLLATFLVLILPAFSGKGPLSNMLFVITMSFLFIQSMIVASSRKRQHAWIRYSVVVIMIVLFVVKPIGFKYVYLDLIRLLLLVFFFVFITLYLIRFMRKAPTININVIITSINIYLLTGIIFASLAFLFHILLPGAYQFPAYIEKPSFVSFNYYSFITMSTVGYGDITPRLPETQTLAYFIAITGQLYVAIVIAFLVGKLLMHRSEEKNGKH